MPANGLAHRVAASRRLRALSLPHVDLSHSLSLFLSVSRALFCNPVIAAGVGHHESPQREGAFFSPIMSAVIGTQTIGLPDQPSLSLSKARLKALLRPFVRHEARRGS